MSDSDPDPLTPTGRLLQLIAKVLIDMRAESYAHTELLERMAADFEEIALRQRASDARKTGIKTGAGK